MIAKIKISCRIVNICIKLVKPENKKKMWNKLFAMLNEDSAIGKAFPNTDFKLFYNPIYYESFQNKIFLSTDSVFFMRYHINRHTTIFGSVMHKK